MKGAMVTTVGDELETTLAYVRQQRETFRYIAHGLSEEELRLKPTKSDITIAWLLKHVGNVIRNWTAIIEGASVEMLDDTVTDEDTVESLLAGQESVAADLEKAVREKGLDGAVEIPAQIPWPEDGPSSWNVRWVLNHLVQEFARHAGHGDIIRESIDGKTMYELQSLAEGWHDKYLAILAQYEAQAEERHK
ncbi:DinB family protein [Salininema proteolyticum]|uniref:DinB family protein n=1 Tax=Salininema proteolyticum TaxID=1607685 RepID=A0ABV8TSG4_9ACTN